MRNETYLSASPDNFQPLTPLDFLDRVLMDQPDSQAIIWQEQFWDYRQFGSIVGRLRNNLGEMHIESDDVVSVKHSAKSVSIPVEVFSETTSDNLNILTGR